MEQHITNECFSTRKARHRYKIVCVKIWSDEKFRRLMTDARFLLLYLLTCPEHTSIPGCIVAGKASLAESLQWTTQQFTAAFSELTKAGMAEADFLARPQWQDSWRPSRFDFSPWG